MDSALSFEVREIMRHIDKAGTVDTGEALPILIAERERIQSELRALDSYIELLREGAGRPRGEQAR